MFNIYLLLFHRLNNNAFPVVSVKFAESSYDIDILEGDTGKLCIEISGSLETKVFVSVSTVEDEAQG